MNAVKIQHVFAFEGTASASGILILVCINMFV